MLEPDRRVLLAGAAAVLGGCANARVVGLDKAKRSLDIAHSGEPLSLDPHRAASAWENNIIGNMFVGLTTEGRDAQPVPGMAERWETGEDGLSWTFFLRQALWSDGETCDAHDFQFAFRRMIDPRTHAQYASLLYPIHNAETVARGEAPPDQIGVTALDDRTLQIDLEHPAPYLPHLLMHPACYPTPKHVVERYRDAWLRPDHIVSNGPFVLRKWLSNHLVHQTYNPRFYDAGRVALRDLYYYAAADEGAAAQGVESRERGWSTAFPSDEAEALAQSAPGYVRVGPSLMTNYLCFNLRQAPFDDARVRRALSMAIDRGEIARLFKTGERAAHSLVPPGVAGYPVGARYAWSTQSMQVRRTEAQRLLRAAGFGPSEPLRFTFAHAIGADELRVATAVCAQWSELAPWVACEAQARTAAAHAATLRARRFDVAAASWTMPYNDARSVLYLLETRTGAANHSGYSSAAFNSLVEQSDNQTDPVGRAALMAQAEQVALNDAPLCAISFGVSRNLVHPDLAGYENNAEDIHRARWFGIKA